MNSSAGGRDVSELAAEAIEARRDGRSMAGLPWGMAVIAGIDELAGDIPGAIEAHRAILDVLDSLGAQGARAFTAPELARLIAREAPDDAENHVLKALPTADDDVTAQIARRRALARLRPAGGRARLGPRSRGARGVDRPARSQGTCARGSRRARVERASPP